MKEPIEFANIADKLNLKISVTTMNVIYKKYAETFYDGKIESIPKKHLIYQEQAESLIDNNDVCEH